MSTIRFEAKLAQLKDTQRGSAALLTLPRSASLKLLSRGTTMVEGVLNHFPFRTALESDNRGSHRLKVSTAVREAVRAEVGDTVTVELTRVGDEPETRVPVDLQKALNAVPKAQEAWAKITPMARRDWILSILVVKQTETRRGRLAKTTDMLARGKGRICCFPGLNWLTKEHVTKKETWLPLPKLRTELSCDGT